MVSNQQTWTTKTRVAVFASGINARIDYAV